MESIFSSPYTIMVLTLITQIGLLWYERKFEAINQHATEIGAKFSDMAMKLITDLAFVLPPLILLMYVRTRFSGSTPSTQQDLFDLFVLSAWMTVFIRMTSRHLLRRALTRLALAVDVVPRHQQIPLACGLDHAPRHGRRHFLVPLLVVRHVPLRHADGLAEALLRERKHAANTEDVVHGENTSAAIPKTQ